MTDSGSDPDSLPALRRQLAAAEREIARLKADLAQAAPQISTLELTLQSTTDPAWYRLKAEWNRPGDPVACERLLQISPDLEVELRALSLQPEAYGALLGQTLFADHVRDLFVLARGDDTPLRVLLAVESERLQGLRWERLSAPFEGQSWRPLRPNQRTPFSLYIPSTSDRRFPIFPQDELKALVVIASPPPGHSKVAPFDEELALDTVLAGLGPIPAAVLANVNGAKYPQIVGRPTLTEICQQLAAGPRGPFTLLHMVCHGALIRGGTDSVVFINGDDALPGEVEREGRVAAVPTATFIERLQRLGKERGLPHLAFLSVCDSAVQAQAATAAPDKAGPEDWRGALRGLGQRLVRDLGLKAVVAMTDKISQATALALGQAFYPALLQHGEVDAALAAACIQVGGRGDVTTPALFARVAGKRLFTIAAAPPPLGESEIAAGLARLQPLFKERAPVLLERQLPDLAARLAPGAAAASARQAALDELERLCEESIELPFAELARGATPPKYNGECPFPGLRAFTKEQRRYYRGREALVATLLERLRGQSFLCVLGNSGSGKSSLVAAGVIPVLEEQQRDLVVARMVPGGDPVANLKAARQRLGDARETLLYIDQFEETFTLCRDRQARQAFLDDVLENRGPDRRVVITMRADFLGECATHPGLRIAVQKQPELVPPMTPEELRGAIEAQAKASGLRYESGLTEQILPELAREPGAMPLLQHALAELWQRRHGRWLRRAAWNDEIGGVSGALRKSAEEVWESLDEASRRLLPGIMTKLTRVGDRGGEGPAQDTRQRVAIDDLHRPGATETEREQVRNLVARLAGEGARLLVTSKDEKTQREIVEVAHEALLRHWPRLVGWIDEARDMLRLVQDLRVSAQDWINDGKQIEVIDPESEERRFSTYLEHRGARGKAVRELIEQRGLVLEERAIPATRGGGAAGTMKEYFAACAHADDEDRKRAEAARTRAHLQQERNTRLQERYVQATMEILSRGIVEDIRSRGGVWGGLDVTEGWIKVVGEGQPVLAARVLPEGGRLVVGGHDAVLNYAEAAGDPRRGLPFLEATLRWLQGLQRSEQILVITNNPHNDWPIDDFFRNLEALQLPHSRDRDLPGRIVDDAALAEVGILVIGNRWEPDFAPAEHQAIAAFLKRGGGLFAVGLGWSWPGEENRPLGDYPMNRLLEPYGVRWNEEALDPATVVEADSSARLRLHNRRDEEVDVFWRNFEGQEDYYGTLAPGDALVLETYLTHEWIIKRTGDGTVIAETRVESKESDFEVA